MALNRGTIRKGSYCINPRVLRYHAKSDESADHLKNEIDGNFRVRFYL